VCTLCIIACEALPERYTTQFISNGVSAGVSIAHWRVMLDKTLRRFQGQNKLLAHPSEESMHPLYALFILHFIADGVLQPRWMGKQKSEDFEVLYMHVAIIYAVITIGMFFLVPLKTALEVGAVNAFIHGIIDSIIWRLYKAVTKLRLHGIGALTYHQKLEIVKCFKYYEDKLFYDTIMADQLLHGLTLILVWRLFV
jgi:hypothetical protein